MAGMLNLAFELYNTGILFFPTTSQKTFSLRELDCVGKDQLFRKKKKKNHIKLPPPYQVFSSVQMEPQTAVTWLYSLCSSSCCYPQPASENGNRFVLVFRGQTLLFHPLANLNKRLSFYTHEINIALSFFWSPWKGIICFWHSFYVNPLLHRY